MERDSNSKDPREEAEARLLQGERLATIGRMAAVLAHEIRTPLASIGGFARRVLRRTEPGDPRHEELTIIVEEVARLERLIEEVLGYSRLAVPSLTPADINAEIRRVVQSLQEEFERRNVRVEMNLSRDIPVTRVDVVQIDQAVTNLIVNAMEAMPDGGTVGISTARDGDYIEIAVSDTGCGVQAEHYDRLFSPFFTTKVTGTGLGLPVVAQVVENHHGSVRFDSDAGRGTTFRVRLPLDLVGDAGSS